MSALYRETTSRIGQRLRDSSSNWKSYSPICLIPASSTPRLRVGLTHDDLLEGIPDGEQWPFFLFELVCIRDAQRGLDIISFHACVDNEVDFTQPRIPVTAFDLAIVHELNPIVQVTFPLELHARLLIACK